MRKHPLGIYEKALPKGTSWVEKLAVAKSCGFDFVEMSVDESDERLARLDWTQAERMEIIQAIQQTGVRIPHPVPVGTPPLPVR
ncbi:putative L-xylulose 5-phosphate 3-epimerase [Citrobacter freundii]|nr:putative L-xylulose 5-phosphate 3-epimerase [Citrobacter freundii]